MEEKWGYGRGLVDVLFKHGKDEKSISLMGRRL